MEFDGDRNLPGIAWNEKGQLSLLSRFSFSGELLDVSRNRVDPPEFYMDNENFLSGDAEYWYQLVRTVKPRRIIEIGSGFSTLMARKALLRNRADDPNYQCDHICVEPYEMPWLEGVGVSVVRKKVEDMKLDFFSQLSEGDILFIDSSHVIRPHGDVLFEYLELLPSLNKGVIVHVHDIFSPRNYLSEWIRERLFLWNEQYLLEAFLTNNRDWEIIGAVNWLHHHHYDALKKAAPFLTPSREPGSFYIRKLT